MIKTPINNTKIAVLALLSFLSCISLYSQSYNHFDSGYDDLSMGIIEDSINGNYYLLNNPPSTNPIRFSQKVNIDSNLSQGNITNLWSNPHTYSYVQPIENVHDYLIYGSIDRSKSVSFFYATKYYLVQYDNSNILDSTRLLNVLNDTLYNSNVLTKTIADTSHFLISGIHNENQVFPTTYYTKFHAASNIIEYNQLPTQFIKPRFSNDSQRLVGFHSDILQLPGGDLLTVCNLHDSTKKSLSSWILLTDATFTNIKNSWPTNFTGGTKRIVRDGQNIYIVSSSLRYRGVGKIPNTDFSLEMFNYLTDTLPTRYFYSPNDTALPTQDVLTAAYFNGTHFILAGMSDYDPGTNEKYTMEFLTMDKNFNLINRRTYTDSTDDFYPLTYSILPHPKDTTTFIMSGTITDPSVSSTSNVFWTTYNAFENISLPEQKLFRKARIHLFPNPSSGDVQLLYPSEDFKPYEIEVYNAEGKLVHRETVESGRQTINLKLPAGAYTLYHTDGSHYEYHPLIIQ